MIIQKLGSLTCANVREIVCDRFAEAFLTLYRPVISAIFICMWLVLYYTGRICTGLL
jgi:hypothetical protein